MTAIDHHTINLRALNSLTKYPSIPTYHALDPRNGSLTDSPVLFDGPVIGTEKVDGTNARIILMPGGSYFLGSRENLLYASGDLIGDPSQGIVEHLRPVADSTARLGSSFDGDTALVLYLELYGGKIGGQARQYSTHGAVGWRLFDTATIGNLTERLGWPAERISGWRDRGGQTFSDEADLRNDAEFAGVDLVPRLFTVDASEVPTSVEGMHAFLTDCLPRTLVALDESGKGQPEGIVLRTPDRSTIAKARFQDYGRTLKRRGR